MTDARLALTKLSPAEVAVNKVQSLLADKDVREFLARHPARLSELSEALPEARYGGYMGTIFGSADELRRAKEAILTPWQTINDRTGGILAGAIVAIPGASGDGKTAVLDSIRAFYCKRGIPNVIAEAEMGPPHSFLGMARNLLQRDLPELGVEPTIEDLDAFVDRHLGGDTFRGVYRYAAHNGTKQLPLMLEDLMGFVDGEFPQCRVVIVDYMSRMRSRDEMIRELSKWEAEEQIGEKFQAWLQDTGRVAFVGAQFNREGVSAGSKQGRRDRSMIAGSISQLFYCHYMAEIIRDDDATRLNFTKRRFGVPAFSAVYSYTPCEAILHNNRGFLTLGEERLEAVERKEREDKESAEFGALTDYFNRWQEAGSPPPIATERGEQLLEVAETQDGRLAVPCDAFSALWRAHRDVAAKVVGLGSRGWGEDVKIALATRGFTIRRFGKKNANHIVWKRKNDEAA